MIISIDGPSGSGKSTVGDALAQKLKFVHFNSGLLYRAIAAHLLANNEDLSKVESSVYPIILKTEFVGGVQHVFVNNIDYTAHLRDNQVSVASPTVSKNIHFRRIIDNCQRAYANNHNVVIDGRDIGSYVFPEADFKFYLDCSPEERANRRYKELKQKIDYQQILSEIKQRDYIDKTKPIAPLVVPQGAVVIDSTYLTLNEVVDFMYNHIKTHSKATK